MKTGVFGNSNSLIFIIILCFTASYGYCQPLAPHQIEQIRRANIIESQEIESISQYISNEIYTLDQVADPAETLLALAKINKSLSAKQETRTIYSDTYTLAVLNGCVQLREKLKNISDNPNSDYLYSLSILAIANSDNQLTFNELIKHTTDKDICNKYFALSGLAMPAISKYLASDAGEAANQQLTSNLSSLLEKENSCEIIRKIALTAVLSTDQGISLLEKCIDKRIQQYQNWKSVGNELTELAIFNKILSSINSGENIDFKRRESKLMFLACQIYNLAWQRYYLGSSEKPEGTNIQLSIFKNSPSEPRLQTILIEGERKLTAISEQNLIPVMTGYNLLSRNWPLLQRQIDSITGTNGVIENKFQIFDNNTEDGFAKLDKPPAEMLQNASNLAQMVRTLLDVSY